MLERPDVEELFREGASMTADDAENLERNLGKEPDHFDTRARLLGYYVARGKEAFKSITSKGEILFMSRGTSEREALAQHAAWFARNAPHSSLAGHPLFQFSMGESIYAELSSIWRRQVATHSPDSTVFANAITFFWSTNGAFADELLTRAERLFPSDPRWAEFRRQTRAIELDCAFQFPQSSESGFASGGPPGEAGPEEATRKGLNEIEQLLRESEGGSEWIPRLREIAGELSLANGRIERARAHAEEMVTIVGEVEGGDGDAVHNGHLLLGRIAVRENDIGRAGAHLILAGQAGATGMVPIFGPDMRLAAELLARDEREVVMRYLALCRFFWRGGPVDEWIAQIRAGDIPDFGRNLKRGRPA